MIWSVSHKSEYFLCGSHRCWGDRDQRWWQACSGLGVMLYITVEGAIWELGLGVAVAHIIQTEVKLRKASWRRGHLKCICGECGRTFRKNSSCTTMNDFDLQPSAERLLYCRLSTCLWLKEWRGQAEHQAFPANPTSRVCGTWWNFSNLVTLADQNLCCNKMAYNTRQSKCQRNRIIGTTGEFILTFKYWSGSRTGVCYVCVHHKLKWSSILMDLVTWPQGKLLSRRVKSMTSNKNRVALRLRKNDDYCQRLWYHLKEKPPSFLGYFSWHYGSGDPHTLLTVPVRWTKGVSACHQDVFCGMPYLIKSKEIRTEGDLVQYPTSDLGHMIFPPSLLSFHPSFLPLFLKIHTTYQTVNTTFQKKEKTNHAGKIPK